MVKCGSLLNVEIMARISPTYKWIKIGKFRTTNSNKLLRIMTKGLLLFLLTAISTIGFGQAEDTLKNRFILASMSFEVGKMMDQYQAIDLVMMYDLTKTPTDIDRNLTDHTVTFDEVARGSRIGFQLNFIPFNKKSNDYSTTSEMRLGMVYSARGTNLAYDWRDTSGAYQSVNYSTRFKEVSLNGAYVWKYSPEFAKRFTFSGGLGLGIGSTLFDKTSVAEHFSGGEVNEIPFSKFNQYKGNSSLFFRAYVPLGVDFALAERFDIGITGNCGMGLQKVVGGGKYLIPFSGSLGLKLTVYL